MTEVFGIDLETWISILGIAGALGIPAVIISIGGYLYHRRKKLSTYYNIMWKKSSVLTPTDILGLRGKEEYGFRKEYFKRKEDEIVKKRINNKNVLIVGSPLSGKTRTIYEGLINLKKPCDVLVLKAIDITLENFEIPPHITFWRKKVLVLDDLDKFARLQNFNHVLREFLERDIIIIASCRRLEYETLHKELESELFAFGDPIRIGKISDEKAEEIAEDMGIDLSRFDGNIGSLFIPLKTMKNRFTECTKEERGVLRSIKCLYYAGIYEGKEIFSRKRIKYICEKKEGIQKQEYEWIELFRALEIKGFIEVNDDEIVVEEAYLEHVLKDKIVEERSELQILEEMIDFFSGDGWALLKIGNKAWYAGIVKIQKAAYMKTAIIAFKEALKVYTLKNSPMDYATTQNNLGNAYQTLAKVKEKAENCQKAITAYKEALKVRTLETFPIDYATTQNNLGTAYRTLAEVKEKGENCQKAITAYKEALKVRTLETFPIDYAMTQNNLGNAYGTLAEVEEKAENCQKAITAYKEALKVRTLETFPIDYAMTQNNLGNAYRTLAEVEEKAENCQKAITAYKEALKVYTLETFPIDYAMTQNNLGTAYGTLAEVKEKAENCQKAITAYKEALKVYTEDKFPDPHQVVKSNLTAALNFCSDG